MSGTTTNMLTINGVTIATPSKFTITLNDLDSEETGRSLDGNLHRDVIGTNFRTIDLEWKTMTRNELQTLLAQVSNKTFTVVYYDPIQDTRISKIMYAGNRKIDMYNYVLGKDGTPIWTDISVSLIQVYNNKSNPDSEYTGQ